MQHFGAFFDQDLLFFPYVNQKNVSKALYYTPLFKNIEQNRIKRQNLSSEIVKSLGRFNSFLRKRTQSKKKL